MKSIITATATLAICLDSLLSSTAAAAPDVSGKIVLANLDRYNAVLRFGKTRREIKPKKASVVSPKKYPVTVEYWSGNTKSGWKKQTIDAAGIYGLNFKRGSWVLAPLKKGKTARPAQTVSRADLKRRVVRKPAIRQPARRSPINADRSRLSPLARVAWGAASVYQFVRDEKDRDLVRGLLIRGRKEDLKDLDRWLNDSDKIAIPHKEELRNAFGDLSKLSEEDWKEIDSADEKDWDLAKADLGDLVSADDWTNLTSDLADINTQDFWEDNTEVNLDEIDFADNVDIDGSIDIGDDLDLSENLDVGDLGIDSDNYDLGDFDDFGGYDGAFDVDPGDFGGDDIGDDDFGDFGGGDDFDF